MYLVVIHVSYPRQNLSPRFRLYGSRTRQPARQGTRQEGPGEDPGHGQPTDAVGQRTKRHVCGRRPRKGIRQWLDERAVQPLCPVRMTRAPRRSLISYAVSARAGRTEGTACTALTADSGMPGVRADSSTRTRRAEEALFAAPPTSDRVAMTPDPDVAAGAGAARGDSGPSS